jgi:hypothetical protein
MIESTITCPSTVTPNVEKEETTTVSSMMTSTVQSTLIIFVVDYYFSYFFLYDPSKTIRACPLDCREGHMK